MKNKIKKLALVFMALALLVACSQEETTNENQDPASEQASLKNEDQKNDQDDTIHVVSNEIPYFLDPTQKMSGTYWKGVNAVETIMTVTADGEVVPGLAESIDQRDEYTWAFVIPENVKFWSGTDLNADNLIECIERNRTDSPDGASLLEGLTFQADGENSVLVKTERENQNVPIILTDVYVFNPESDFSTVENIDFTGPYQITEYVPKSYTSLTAFEGYYGDQPKIKNIYWEEVPDPDARALAAQNGEADIVQNLTPSHIEQVEQAGQCDVYSISPSGTLSVYVNLEREPYNDKNVCQALSWALDRDELSLLAFDGVLEPSSTWLGTNPQFQDQRRAVYDKQDLGKSEELLKESGWEKNSNGILEKDGETMDFILYTWGNDKFLGEAIQNQWMALGVNVDLRHVDYSLIEEARQTGEWDGLIETWTNFGDYYPIAYGHFGPDGSVNYGNYDSPIVQEALVTLEKTADPEEQKELMTTINLQVAEDTNLISLMPRPVIVAVSKDIEGFIPHFMNHSYNVNTNMEFK